MQQILIRLNCDGFSAGLPDQSPEELMQREVQKAEGNECSKSNAFIELVFLKEAKFEYLLYICYRFSLFLCQINSVASIISHKAICSMEMAVKKKRMEISGEQLVTTPAQRQALCLG